MRRCLLYVVFIALLVTIAVGTDGSNAGGDDSAGASDGSDDGGGSADGGGNANVTTQSSQSVFGVLGSEFTKAVVGLVIFLLAFPVLWFNELRAVKMWALYGKARTITRQNVSCDKVDHANEACLVHMIGKTSTQEKIGNNIFGVFVEDTVKFSTLVEMYQWHEKTKESTQNTNTGGKTTTTTYTYEKEWSDVYSDSQHFQEAARSKHRNPEFPFRSEVVQASEVTMGAFFVPEPLVSKMCAFEAYIEDEKKPITLNGKVFARVGRHRTTVKKFHPEIGDIRVRFERVPCRQATVLALQSSNTFIPFRVGMDVTPEGKVMIPASSRPQEIELSNLEKGKDGGTSDATAAARPPDDLSRNTGSALPSCCCICVPCFLVASLVESFEEIFELVEAELTARQLIGRGEKAETNIRCTLRFLGWAMLALGLYFMAHWLPALFRLIPFVGTYLESFLSVVVGISAVILASVIWLLTVAIAWVFARPRFGIGLIIVAFGFVGAMHALMPSKAHATGLAVSVAKKLL